MTAQIRPKNEKLEDIILQMSAQEAEAFNKILEWYDTARDKQLPPDGDWLIWLLLAGRGFGKTHTGAAFLALNALTMPNIICGVSAPTSGDLKKVCFEGPSGLLRFIPDSCIIKDGYNKSDHQIRLYNGSTILGFPASKPDRLRGPQYHYFWGDEVAAWEYPEEAMDNILFGLRLGDDPKMLLTTTPRPIDIIIDLVKTSDGSVTTVSGNTFENSDNLSERALEKIKAKYEGTRIGRQELYAEILDDIEGALWLRSDIDAARVNYQDYREMMKIIIAIDPAVTNTDTSDETGIVVAGCTRNREYYVFEDISGKYSAEEWGRIAVNAYYRYEATSIVAEVNNGGDLVGNVIKNIDINVPYKQVRATRGKILRAEPVAALYEQHRVHHVGAFKELEDQMCNYSPINKSSSPDRLDAMVWAISQLSDEPGEAYWKFHV